MPQQVLVFAFAFWCLKSKYCFLIIHFLIGLLKSIVCTLAKSSFFLLHLYKQKQSWRYSEHLSHYLIKLQSWFILFHIWQTRFHIVLHWSLYTNSLYILNISFYEWGYWNTAFQEKEVMHMSVLFIAQLAKWESRNSWQNGIVCAKGQSEVFFCSLLQSALVCNGGGLLSIPCSLYSTGIR